MKKLLLTTLFACAPAQTTSLFWQFQIDTPQQKGYCIDLRLNNSFEDFLAAINETPHFLAQATQHKDPFIVLTPEDLDGLSPLADGAPAIEGARTALTWARSYYQVLPERYDLRIIKIPATLINTSQEKLITFALEKQPALLTIDQEDALLLCVHTYTDNPRETITSSPTLTPYKVPNQTRTPLIFTTPFDQSNGTGKRYLVAGGSGFIGYHVVKTLLEKGHHVIALDNNACSSKDNLTEFNSNPRFAFIHHDITMPFTIDEPLNVIINLASIPSPAFYYRMPLETLAVGLQGSLNLLAIMCEKHARYIFTSTSEVYGDPLVHPQTEEYSGKVNYLGKRAQYDQSKRCAETLLKLTFEQDPTLDIRIARLFNTYGPPMMLHDGRVVTNFIGNIIANKPLIMYGDGMQTRSFGYVEDTVKGIISLIHNEQLCTEPLITNRVFNLGTPFEITINELAEKADQLCVEKYGRHAHFEYRPQIDKTDPARRLPDITRAHTILGFNPRIRLEEGLEKTWAYFEKK